MYRIVFLCLSPRTPLAGRERKKKKKEREREREGEGEGEGERGYFVCTHADILPTLSALLLPWSRGDFWGGEVDQERSIPAPHGPEPPPAALPSASSAPRANSRV